MIRQLNQKRRAATKLNPAQLRESLSLTACGGTGGDEETRRTITALKEELLLKVQIIVILRKQMDSLKEKHISPFSIVFPPHAV